MATMAMVITGYSDSQLSKITGNPGTIVYNSTTGELVMMDGVTPGGSSLATDDEVASEVASITSSGGQVLPTLGTPTANGNVVVWDGNAWDESSDFYLKTDVNQKFVDLAPASGNSTATQFLQWDNGKLKNATVASSGGGVHAPASSTPTDGVLQYDTTASDWVVSQDFALKSYADSAVQALKGTTTTYSTLQAAEAQILTHNSQISSNLAALGTKSDKPSRDNAASEVLIWKNGAFDYSTDFAVAANVTSSIATKSDKPASSSITSATQNEVLAWDASANSGAGAFIHKDLQPSIDAKAPKPPTGIQAGEFLRWDETNEVFTFATPAGGGGGTSIPTPATTTDYTTAGAMQVLIWDNTSGDLKNVASPFVEPPPASAAGEYLRWDATLGWINDTPAGGGGGVSQPPDSAAGEFLRWNPALNSGAGDWENATPAGSGGSSFGTPTSGTLANEAVTWDGTSAFVNTAGYAMLTDLTGKADKPAAVTGANEFVQWTASGWTNTALSTVGVSAGSFVSPTTSTGTGQHVIWNGSSFENASEFATESMLDEMFPASTSPTSNRAVLSWDGTKTINRDFAPATATPNNQFVKWNGTTFENVALSTTGMTTTGFVNPATTSGDTDALQWNGSALVNVPNFRPDPAMDTTGNGEVLGWDGTQYYKKTISISSADSSGSFSIQTDTSGGIVFKPDYTKLASVVAAANSMAMFDIIDNGTEIILRPVA